MKKPASPRHGAAGEIESKNIRNRSHTAPHALRQTPTADVPPNWRHIGGIIDKIADLDALKPGSSS